jgi:hypothetical protein
LRKVCFARKTGEDIIRRTTAGRERALRGMKFGRKPKLSPVQQGQALRRRGAPGRNSALFPRQHDNDLAIEAKVIFSCSDELGMSARLNGS